MNPIRFIFGLALVYFCVFGIPEGCLVLPSHATPPRLQPCNIEPGGRNPPGCVGKEPSLEVPSLLPPQAAPPLPAKG